MIKPKLIKKISPAEERQRMLIEQLWEVWQLEPGVKISARKLAERAGINTSGIYQYFDTMDELYYYASVHFLKFYAHDISNRLNADDDPLVQYAELCKCFNEHAFYYPMYYQYIYTNKYASMHNSMVEYYMNLFPEDIPEEIQEHFPMISGKDLHSGDIKLLQLAADKGEIDAKDIEELASANTILVRGLVDRFVEGDFNNYETLVDRTTSMQVHMLLGYCKNPKKVECLLKEYLK